MTRLTRTARAVVVAAGWARTGRAQTRPAAPPPPLAITHVNVVPMDRERVLADQTVLVRGGRIVAVGPAAHVVVPPGARHLDGRGRFLIPGLVDAHTHVVEERRVARPVDDALRRESAALNVAAGVTTALSLCGADRAPAFRDSVARGVVPGPTLVVSPPCLDDSTMTAAEGAAAAARARRAGFDFVKVYTRLSAAGFRGLTAEAGRLALPVLGHIPTRVGLQGTLDAGAAAVAHAEEFLYNAPFRLDYTAPDSAPALDPARVPGVVHAVHASGAAVVTTLVAYTVILDQAVDLAAVTARPSLRVISPGSQTARGWDPRDNERARRLHTPAAIARLRMGLAFQRRLVRAFHDRGVVLLAGTDAGGDIPLVPGRALHDELAALVEAGLTPYQALRTATFNPGAFLAARFRLPPRGTVTPGGRADLVLLDADPLIAVANTRRVRAVVTNGRPFDRAALDALLGGVRRAADPAGANPAGAPPP